MECSEMILGLLVNILRLIFRPVFWLCCGSGKKRIPPVENELLLMSATKLAENIRKREIKSVDIVRVYIKRVKQVNPIINAVVEDRFEAALEDAKDVDDFLKKTTMSYEELLAKKPLLGVPLTVKECCGVKGMKMTLGSLHRIDDKAKYDGASVTNLRKAGAIIILISNTPENYLSMESTNLVTGRTKNPYDTSRTPGGSSGGEGALLGSAASLIGVGSDLLGSIRMPSCFNGVFGHKPSRGVISIEHHMPIQKSDYIHELFTVGPMCRYAEDLTVMTKVMAGDEENKLGLDDHVDLSQIDVYFMESSTHPVFQFPVQKEFKKAVRQAVLHLKDRCKSRINSNKFPGLSRGFFMGVPVIMAFDLSDPGVDAGIKDRKNFSVWSELMKSLIGKSQYSFPLLYFHLLHSITKSMYGKRVEEMKSLADDLRTNMLSKLGTNGVFIYPNFPMTAPYQGEFCLQTLGVMYMAPFNVLGFPSTSVPMGLDENGLPVSIQVIAAPNQDKLCIAVAKELSKLYGWIPPY